LLDASFVTDAAKLIAGNLTALACMVHLELPHINASIGTVKLKLLSETCTACRLYLFSDASVADALTSHRRYYQSVI
jgi:hypothetical protein